MIIYLYRWKIKSGFEKQFEDNWSLVTKEILKECGSQGSRLHITEGGDYIAYAQWPDYQSREKCKIQESPARQLMKDAIEHSYPEETLEVKSDLLLKS